MINIAETYKYKDGREYFKVAIPITRPEKDANANMISFESESYLKVMQSEYVNEMLNNGGMPIVLKAPEAFDSIRIEDIIGRVIEWNTEHIVVEITPNNYNLYISPYNESGVPIKAGVIGIGDFVDGSKTVFALQKVVAFQLLYGESAKTYKRIPVEDATKKKQSKRKKNK